MNTQTIKHYLINYLKAQLVVTLVSFPILISWGLSLSIMSIVGNLIFIPLLTIFLLVSSLIFFTEICMIPNGLLIIVLNYLSTLWQVLLSLGNKQWLIGFAKPHFLILCIVCIIFISTLYAYSQSPTPQIKPLILMFLLNCTFLYGYTQVNNYFFSCSHSIVNEKLSIVLNKNGSIAFVDNGFFNRKRTVGNTVRFEIQPYLLKTFGTLHIQELRLNKPSGRSFIGALELCKCCKVDSVVVPYFNKRLSKYAWFFFFELKRTLKEQGIPFIRRSLKSELGNQPACF